LDFPESLYPRISARPTVGAAIDYLDRIGVEPNSPAVLFRSKRAC
jgi:hypothetical protein